MKYLYLLFIVTMGAWLLDVHPAQAQALDAFSTKKGVTMNGSLSTSTTAYAAHGIESRRDPFAWYVNGNINMNLFGYDMPFSFSYSNQGKNYSQPFNQFRFAPSYKWARLYVGNTSMNFSNYTLAGHMFNGVGVELTPAKWHISAMYGTLLKAVPFDVLSPESYSRASFERKGQGLKVAYENEGNTYGISFFHAKDDAASLPYIPDDASITPRENVAIAFNVRQTIIQHIFVDLEYSVSALNRDVRGEKNAFDSSRGTSNLLSHFLSPTNNTRYFDAIQAGLGYNGAFYTIQLRYERVAPDYVTLGAYNVVNDMRNITVAPSVKLFNGRVNLSANAGMQVNNLDNSKNSDAKRWVVNGNANVSAGQHWVFNGGYSNFSNYTRVRPQIDPYFNNPLDTLDFYQVNNTYNGMVMYHTGNKERQQAITFNSSYQYASDRSSNDTTGPMLSRFFTSNLSYAYTLPPKDLTMSASVNYYKNSAAGLSTTFVGPGVNVNKLFLEKTLRTGISAVYNVTEATSTLGEGLKTTTNSTLFNTGLNVNYSPKGKQSETTTDGEGKRKFFNKQTHTIGANISWVIRGATANQRGYNELTSTLNYTYSF